MTADFEIDTTAGDVAPGTYLATLIGWSPFYLYELTDGSWSRTDPEDGTEPTTRIEWTFALEDGQTVNGTSSTAYRSPLAKMRAWCKGLGLDMAVPQKLNATTLCGRTAMITVEPDKAGYSKVVAVNPAPKSKS